MVVKQKRWRWRPALVFAFGDDLPRANAVFHMPLVKAVRYWAGKSAVIASISLRPL
jgi:hypothetical protein